MGNTYVLTVFLGNDDEDSWYSSTLNGKANGQGQSGGPQGRGEVVEWAKDSLAKSLPGKTPRGVCGDGQHMAICTRCERIYTRQCEPCVIHRGRALDPSARKPSR